MAKISVSLSDELKAKLDAHVTKGQGISEVVQAALELYFQPQPAPEAPVPANPALPPAVLPPGFLRDFSELQDYLAASAVQAEQMRLTLWALHEYARATGFITPPPPAAVYPPQQLKERLR